MFVITADQINSRREDDLAGAQIERINASHGRALTLPADRTAGDELQAVTADAATALALALELHRTGHFSVGIGLGPVREPLPASTREASGPAFFAARDAVNRAKGTGARLALQQQTEASGDSAAVADTEALLALLLIVRDRRSAAGWELFDLVADGLTQAQSAARLGISAPAASDRARAAHIRAELAASPALVRLLAQAETDATTGGRR